MVSERSAKHAPIFNNLDSLTDASKTDIPCLLVKSADGIRNVNGYGN